MKNDVVLFLIMISLMKIKMVSTEVIFKRSKDKLKILQAEKINHNNEENSYKKYKRNLEFLISTSSKSVSNPLIIQKNFKAKKISQEEAKICNRKTCKFPYGECVNDKICKCLEPYANLDILAESEDNKINYNVNTYSSTNNTYNSNNNTNYNLNNNINFNYNSNLYCGYKRKSQLIAFALEAIFTAGIGHLYSKRLLHGFVKLSLFFILGLIYFLVKIKNIDVEFSTNNEQNKTLKITLLNVFIVSLVTGLLALQTYDMVMFGTNSFLDGFGVPLISWNKGFGDLFLFDNKKLNYLDI